MERQEKKALLDRYPYIMSSIRYYEERLQELDDIGAPTAKLSDMPHVSGISNPTQELGERRAELAEHLLYNSRLKIDIERGIERLGAGVHQRILILRFVQSCTQSEVAARTHYSRSQVQRLENEAVDLFEIEERT